VQGRGGTRVGKGKKGKKGRERRRKQKREGVKGKGEGKKGAGRGYSQCQSWFASGAAACTEILTKHMQFQ